MYATRQIVQLTRHQEFSFLNWNTESFLNEMLFFSLCGRCWIKGIFENNAFIKTRIGVIRKLRMCLKLHLSYLCLQSANWNVFSVIYEYCLLKTLSWISVQTCTNFDNKSQGFIVFHVEHQSQRLIRSTEVRQQVTNLIY